MRTPTEPEPAPAQTARELGERAIDDLLNQAQPILQLAIDHIRHIANRCAQAEGEIIIAQARADRAEADIAAITANCLKLSQIVEQVRAERDRLREALEKTIVAFKGEPCVAPDHPHDGYKCKFSAHPIGRKWGGYCDNHNIDLIARAALNQTTNQ